MFRARQLILALQPLCEASGRFASAFTLARPARYLPPDPFNLRLSTVNLPFLSPFRATLTDTPQFAENTATLSPAFATLARPVTPNPFVCHSYEKHPGWGMHPRAFSPIFRLVGAIPFRIRTYEKATRNPFRMRTSKTQHLKSFRIRTYEKRGRGSRAIPQPAPALCYSQSLVNILSAGRTR